MPLINTHILMSDAKNFANTQPINPYYHSELVNVEHAVLEHEAIHRLFHEAGIKIIDVKSPSNSQDGVYTANWALVRGDKAVMSRLPAARLAEQDYAEKILKKLGKTIYHVPDDLKFSGQGDALACGNLLFCGNGYRSDIEAQQYAAEVLGYERIQLQTVPQLDENKKPIINSSTGWPDSFFYDIDLALAVIKAPSATEKGLIAYCPEAFVAESRKKLSSLENIETIKISLDEAKNGFAANLVSTGEVVIMSANAPKLTDELRKHDLIVLTPKITELAKGGGYIRCMTLTVS